jgi:hypothetical protein
LFSLLELCIGLGNYSCSVLTGLGVLDLLTERFSLAMVMAVATQIPDLLFERDIPAFLFLFFSSMSLVLFRRCLALSK